MIGYITNNILFSSDARCCWPLPTTSCTFSRWFRWRAWFGKRVCKQQRRFDCYVRGSCRSRRRGLRGEGRAVGAARARHSFHAGVPHHAGRPARRRARRSRTHYRLGPPPLVLDCRLRVLVCVHIFNPIVLSGVCRMMFRRREASAHHHYSLENCKYLLLSHIITNLRSQLFTPTTFLWFIGWGRFYFMVISMDYINNEGSAGRLYHISIRLRHFVIFKWINIMYLIIIYENKCHCTKLLSTMIYL